MIPPPDASAPISGFPRTILRYLFALGCVLAAGLTWYALTPLIGNRVSSTFFLVAILVAGRFAGLGPSWLALASGGCCVAYIQYLRLGLQDPAFPSILGIYFVLGTILVRITHSERAARASAEATAELLRQQMNERADVERQVREQHQQLELALAAGRFGAFDWDVRAGKVAWSPTNELIHGFLPGAFDGTFEQSVKNVHPDDRESILRQTAAAIEGGPTKPLAYRVVWPDGSVHWIEGVGLLFRDAEGALVRVRGVCADITARKQTELALQLAEERFRLLAMQAPVGIYLANEAGRCTFVNHQWCEISGARPEDALGAGWQSLIHPDDLGRLMEAWSASARNDRQFSMEFRYQRKNGDIRWVDGSAVVLKNDRGEVIGHLGTVMDITARKASADALQEEQKLLRESIELQERDRKTIAYDIHDGMIQYATGALMFLESYAGKHEGSLDDGGVGPALVALRQAIADGRRVMNGVRPPLLDDAGVVAAIETLAAEHRTAAIDIEFDADEDLDRFRPELETTLYRIAQEAIFNAIKHSGSRKIQISLWRDEMSVRLAVRDWGVGFDLRKAPRGVHGLSGIQERAKLVGGQCTIVSLPQNGTCISVELPLGESQELVPQR